VEIRARVGGFLTGILFKDGADVTETNQLFQVDRRPYQVQYARDGAQLRLAEANMRQAEADLSRAAELAKTPGAISKQDFDNFEDHHVDAGTGTLRLRALVDNPVGKNGKRLLSPGLFARVRLDVGTPRKAVLTADRAVAADQGRKYLYVVKDMVDSAGGEVRQV